MDKYRLVKEHTAGDGAEHDINIHNNDDNDNSNNNIDGYDESTMSCEVRITQQGKPRNYISYAMKLFVRVCIVCE